VRKPYAFMSCLPGPGRFRPAFARRKRFAWLVVFGVLASLAMLAASGQAASRPAQGLSREECLSVPSRVLAHAVPYCILLPPSYDAEKTRRYPVLYYFHGLGDDEHTLLNQGVFNFAKDAWEHQKLGEFLIVTPQGGASFYVNSRDGTQRYEDFFLQEFLPSIERQYRIESAREFRAIGGISMGGYGALHLAFGHPGLFGAVSAHSAVLIERLPIFAFRGTHEFAVQRNFGNVFGSPINRTFWYGDSPLTLARTGDLGGLKIYFDCGASDPFGFNKGALALHNVLASRGIPHEFHLYPGRHDWSYFNEHLPASINFHSRAFAVRSTLAGCRPEGDSCSPLGAHGNDAE
jgi:S-formylglutathione hydrolase FrmB